MQILTSRHIAVASPILLGALALTASFQPPWATDPGANTTAASATTPAQGLSATDVIFSPAGVPGHSPHYFTARGVSGDKKFLFGARPIPLAENIKLEWMHYSSKLQVDKTVSVAFIPTSTCHGHQNDQIYVAGKGDDGITRLERWTLRMPTEVLNFNTSAVEGLAGGGVKKIDTVYFTADPNVGVITAMDSIVGSNSHLLVKFSGHGEIQVMDTSQRPVTLDLVASADSAQVAPLTVPVLSQFHTGFEPFRVNDGTPSGHIRYYLSEATRGSDGVILIPNADGITFSQVIPIVTEADWVNHGFPDHDDRLPL